MSNSSFSDEFRSFCATHKSDMALKNTLTRFIFVKASQDKGPSKLESFDRIIDWVMNGQMGPPTRLYFQAFENAKKRLGLVDSNGCDFSKEFESAFKLSENNGLIENRAVCVIMAHVLEAKLQGHQKDRGFDGVVSQIDKDFRIANSEKIDAIIEQAKIGLGLKPHPTI